MLQQMMCLLCLRTYVRTHCNAVITMPTTTSTKTTATTTLFVETLFLGAQKIQDQKRCKINKSTYVRKLGCEPSLLFTLITIIKTPLQTQNVTCIDGDDVAEHRDVDGKL